MCLVAQPKHRFFHWGEFCQGRFADIAPLLLVKINSIQNYSIVQRTLADKDVISFLQHLNEEIQSLIRGQSGSTGFSSQSNSYLVFISMGVGMAVLTQEGRLPGTGMGRFMNYPVRWSFLPVGWGFRRATGSKLFTKLYPRGITFVLYKFYHGGNDLMIFYHIVQ